MSRRGFTLIEILVALGVLCILMGSMGTAVNKARRRAYIAKATQECKEMTNAILAFEQYAEGRTLAGYTTGGWTECTESKIAFLLGGETGENGELIPVLFAAPILRGALRDPWGQPYQYTIINDAELESSDSSSAQYVTAPYLTNFYRLSPEERGY